jgi:FkbM family methyltransferase
MFRAERPRDIVVEAAVTDSAAKSIAFHVIEGTGLSTLVDEISEGHSANGFAITELEVATARLDSIIEDAGLSDVPIHFLMIDTEGAELQVLRSIDLTRYRPWILVIEATQPGTTTASYDSWEALVLDAGYEFCLFDGLSRFYVASEMSHLKPLLSFPASAADRYVSDHERRVQGIADSASLRAEHAERAAADAIAALESVKRSVSWRLTRPLRGVRQLLRRN